MKKRLGVITLLTCVLVMMAPQIALADNSQYTEVESMEAIVTDTSVHVYATTGAGSVELTDVNAVSSTFSQGIGFREYTATPNDGWVWKNWTYSQIFRGSDLGNRTDYVFGNRYSFTNDGDDWRTPYNGTGNTISVNRLTTTGEIAGVPITYNLYANFNPTIEASAGVGGSISDAGVNEVEYGTDMTFTITPDEGYTVSSVTVDGEVIEPTPMSDFTFTNVTAPHTIAVEFEEAYTVTYTDGVDGEEVFADMVVTGLVAGDDTPLFDGYPVREGYIFGGWDPVVAETVTGNATYTAIWEAEPAKDDTDKEDPNKGDSDIDDNNANKGDGAENGSNMNGSDKGDSAQDSIGKGALDVNASDKLNAGTLPKTNDPMTPLALAAVALTALAGAFVAFRKSFN